MKPLTFDPSDDDLKSMVIQYQDNVYLKDIGKQFGVNASAISHRMCCLKVPKKNLRIKLLESEIDELIKEFRNKQDNKPNYSVKKYVRGMAVTKVKRTSYV